MSYKDAACINDCKMFRQAVSVRYHGGIRPVPAAPFRLHLTLCKYKTKPEDSSADRKDTAVDDTGNAREKHGSAASSAAESSTKHKAADSVPGSEGLSRLVRPAHSEGGPTGGLVSKSQELLQRLRETPGDSLSERCASVQLASGWHNVHCMIKQLSLTVRV